jgi:uncharacterized protein YaaN involved in tellurite resistance
MPEKRTVEDIRALAEKLGSDIDTLEEMIANRRTIKDLRKELAALRAQRKALEREAVEALFGGGDA